MGNVCSSDKNVHEPDTLPSLQIKDDIRKSIQSPIPKSPLGYEALLAKSPVNPMSPVFTKDFYDCFQYFDKDGNGSKCNMFWIKGNLLRN